MAKQIALHIDRSYQRYKTMKHNLENLGFVLHKAPDMAAAREMAKKHRYHLVIIHLDSAGKEIFSFSSFIRSGSNHTIIIILMSKVVLKVEERLFDCGVNDVVIGKQASANILTKRIQAHLHNSNFTTLGTNMIRLKNTLVDFDRKEVWCNGTVRQLKGMSADILKYFLDNPNHVVSRDELSQSDIWINSICSTAKEGGKTFDVNICKLRKIIEPDPLHPQIIKSVRGVGWVLGVNPVG